MSGLIPQSFIDDLMTRVDIVEVIDARVPLRKSGREFSARCPFHEEKTPSFTVSPSKQFYHCFGCGAHGTALSFMMEYEHLAFPEAVEELARSVGMEVPHEAAAGARPAERDRSAALYDTLAAADRFFRQQLRKHPQAPTAVAYLKARGLSGEIAASFGIGYAPPGWDSLLRAQGGGNQAQERLVAAGLLIRKDDGKCYDRFRERIMFPIRDRRGRTIAFGGRVLGDEKPKYLNSPETPVFHKGQELYGLFEARKALRDIPRLLVVEGYMDVVALAQFGVRYAVATLGTSTTREHLERLFRVSPEVVFCFDGDRAGREAGWRALENALPVMREGRQLRFMFLPDGDDPDTRIRAVGRERFEADLETALPFSEFFYQKLGREADTSTIDGRARFVELARPLLNRMPEGVFRQMMLDRLAELARIDPSRAAQAVGPAAGDAVQTPRRAPRRSPRNRRAPPSLVRQAITLLLHRPSLAALAGDPRRLAELELPGMPLLAELLELLQDKPHLGSGALLTRWRETEHGRHLERLAAQADMDLDALDLEGEFADLVAQLERQAAGKRWEALQQRLEGGERLDAAEREEYNRLLQKGAGPIGINRASKGRSG